MRSTFSSARAGGAIGRRRLHRGFTLIELAIVITIVGLLLGALLVPLRTRIEADRIRETQRMLGEIREALVGYAVTQGALPCPDVVSDGIDGGAPPMCIGAALEGILPYRELGVPRADPWGRHFYYRVTEVFTHRALTGQPPSVDQLDLTDLGDITVLTRSDDPGTSTTTEIKYQSLATALTRTAPAVVLSVGANGLGGISFATGAVLAPPGIVSSNSTPTDEAENTDADAMFVSRPYARGAVPCDDADETASPPLPFCAFDDIVMWISTAGLMARLVEARVLP